MDIGAEVVVRTLRNKRGVVIARDRRGRVHVQVEGMTVWCDETDVELAPAARTTKRHAPRRADNDLREATLPARRLDLHGFRVEEAMARVIDTIDRALVDGVDRLEIVHGKGSGRIRDALQRQLASLPVVKAFHVDARNPGVTWVFF
jgi:DNA mismatch repair protein MutS2